MKISISIPTYNQGQYVEKAILSAFNQTVKPFEIIVSNDCSTDHTKEVLENLKLKVPILKVITQPVNLGIGGNVDACLKAALGDFILRLDSDDYLEPDYCAVISALLVEYPKAGYGHANVFEIDKFDKTLKNRVLFRNAEYQNGEEALKAAVKGYRVAANILMFRKEALESVDFMAGRPDFGEDYHLAADLAAKDWGNVFSPKILSNYRVWTDTGNARQKRKMKELTGLLSVFKDVIEPAYEKRNWDKKTIEKSKENIACSQSDCLGWTSYTLEEINELAKAVQNLSASEKTKRFIYMNRNGYGKYLASIKNIKGSFKAFIKEKLIQKKTI